MANGEAIDVTLRVSGVLERMQIPYFVGGSLASSFHGLPRATQDVDLIVDLDAAHAEALVAEFRDDFYLDSAAIHQAIRRQSSFNMIHFETMFKVDVFVFKADPLSEQEMARRQWHTLEGEVDRRIMVASPEDVVLQKLHGHELGQRVSDRQWHDVLGVLKIHAGKLDMSYMNHVADRVGLAPSLADALLAASK